MTTCMGYWVYSRYLILYYTLKYTVESKASLKKAKNLYGSFLHFIFLRIIRWHLFLELFIP